MFSIFHANWHVAIGTALVFIIATCVATRFWAIYKSRSDRQRAVERLENLGRGEPLEPDPTVKPELPLHFVTEGQPALAREEPLEPEPQVRPRLPMKVGTKVQAVSNFGTIKEGAPGIITGIADVTFFWWSRPTYLCTFADNMKAHARPKQIEAYDHGHCLDELEQPDFGSILSRQITLRAQSVLFQRHTSRLGNAMINNN